MALLTIKAKVINMAMLALGRSKTQALLLNGKLSALRWVLGDGWDMLDT